MPRKVIHKHLHSLVIYRATKLFRYPLDQFASFVPDQPKPLTQFFPMRIPIQTHLTCGTFRGHAECWQARRERRACDDFRFSVMLSFHRVHIPSWGVGFKLEANCNNQRLSGYRFFITQVHVLAKVQTPVRWIVLDHGITLIEFLRLHGPNFQDRPDDWQHPLLTQLRRPGWRVPMGLCPLAPV